MVFIWEYATAYTTGTGRKRYEGSDKVLKGKKKERIFVSLNNILKLRITKMVSESKTFFTRK